MIDEMHVIDARRARCHAGQTRETPVDMFDYLRRRWTIVFEHIFDQIDPSAWTIEFVAQKEIGRASGSTKAAMHAGTQDFF